MEADDLTASVETMTKANKSFEKTLRALDETQNEQKAQIEANEKIISEGKCSILVIHQGP